MKRRTAPQRGYTYLVVLVMLAVLSLASALTLQVAETNGRRSAEAELIAVGKEFERAFASYYRQSPGGTRRFPERLEDLVRDPRLPGVKRHLRRVYVDPLTGGEWQTMPAPGGGIMAVYSSAADKPYREEIGPLLAEPPVMGASAVKVAASQPGSYADWRFGYDPRADLALRGSFILPSPAAPRPTIPIGEGRQQMPRHN
jgi:type II secretory pathway pseudopilin PulG